jgi:hypothetical protein
LTAADTLLILEARTLGATVRLEGQAVTLTGASVDGFDVAAHGDSGGWIGKRELSK